MSDKQPVNRLAERQQQKFLLLLSRDDFQQDIASLRIKWAIPAEGLGIPANHEEWWRTHDNNADGYEDKNYEANRLEVLAAERRWQAKEISTRQFDNVKAEVQRRSPVNAFYYDITQILGKYRLPPRWKDAVQAYLFTNEARYKGTAGVTIQSTFGRDGDPDEISLKLDAHTTRQDLIDAWPSIKFHLDKLKHKTKAKTQPYDAEVLERNKLAYELRQQGKTYKVIAEALNGTYGMEYTYGEIPTMIKNYKKLLGMN